MIDKNLPEPKQEDRDCCHCGKKKRLKGTLIHWPDESCEKSEVRLLSGQMCGTFSTWVYKCAWCRAITTKQRQKYDVDSILATPRTGEE